ncbi:glycosyltransferase family 1 protein [Actinomyces viscosus]|uniref:D-inositol-3-phosphate glycosyltransferase n=1 Tax=Actinomyces viscosus TaxID=1656 RepID=A0A3S4VEA5_ACTVI|nr:glycosyltransferase family 1 protein [Actinomyces viscosus]TFH53827.1 glycosyltransferase family 1 protein [Actinomyces viscosus]VEI16114.1 D-inositol-3-phosphate glycosyltransferase [Actinomyces viscosus]
MVVEQLWQPVPGGSGTYIVELTRALRARQVPVAGIAARHQAAPSPREVGLPPMPMRHSHLPRTALYESWNRLGLPRAESILPGAQLIHATTWALPTTALPLAVTVHDLAFLRAPEHFTPRGNTYFNRSLERVITEASAIIVPSQATADDCIAAGIDAARLYIIPHGVRTRTVTVSQVETFRATRGLGRDYILWTGTREPRKNLLGLLRAFELLIEEHDDAGDLDLVLVGPAGWGDDAVERDLLTRLSDRVHVTGRLDDDELAAAYSGARAFAFPSIWEGFGLPVLEAMAYGTPVVTSTGTCMAEITGEAGLLADPTSPREIASRLAQAIGPAHDELAQAGRERARTFTWEACAAAHTEVYHALIGGAV